MDSSKHPSDQKQHVVIDTLGKTRSDHHEEPFPHKPQTIRRNSASDLDRIGSDVVDQALQQSEAIPIPTKSTSPSPPLSSSAPLRGSPTALKSSWQPLASMSSNQLPSKVIVDSIIGSGSGTAHENEHEKHSVLPGILPGFKDRMADIHHATYKNVSDGSKTNSDDTNDNNSNNNGHRRKLSKSSILYESADLTEPVITKLPEREEQTPANTSSTLIQGGQGGRHWSHEISPEKAGLPGAALGMAGVLKDVILDKIQQRSISKSSSTAHHDLSNEEKLEAAKVAFGGSEEAGDQTVYLEGLQEHLRHEQAEQAAAQASLSPAATTATAVLDSAPDAALAHHKSIFHLAANPDTKKSMLIDHPESMGYHARDLNHAPFEESSQLGPQHRLAGDTNARSQGISKMSR
ncbi:hypothetical protein BGZ46_010935 [Entomortierella lignicola]|nr:hypothetical protein BGZ46_010935 [Entomortierella lignicola]